MGRKPKIESKEKYDWFIEPLNTPTNEALSRILSATDFYEDQADNAGNLHNFWQCRFSLIEVLMNSKTDKPELKFKPFCRNRLSGYLTEFFWQSKKSPAKTCSKELKAVLGKLDNLKRGTR